MKPRNELSQKAAENVAIQALTYLASDPERLGRFLALSGLDHASIRAASAEPGFLGGVLEHIVGDEQLLVEFAEFAELNPARSGPGAGHVERPALAARYPLIS